MARFHLFPNLWFFIQRSAHRKTKSSLRLDEIPLRGTKSTLRVVEICGLRPQTMKPLVTA